MPKIVLAIIHEGPFALTRNTQTLTHMTSSTLTLNDARPQKNAADAAAFAAIDAAFASELALLRHARQTQQLADAAAEAARTAWAHYHAARRPNFR